MITAGPRNKIGPIGPQGPMGPEGPKGLPGVDGDSPEFQWRGTEIRFRKPDGSWGKWTDLRGARGLSGISGPRGEIGPQGPPGPTAELIELDTTVDTQPGDPVVVTGTNFVEKISDNSSLIMPNGIFGFGHSKSSTTKLSVMFLGKLQQFTNLLPGEPYFISTGGSITINPPVTGMVQQVGFAIAADTLLVNLMQPMRRS